MRFPGYASLNLGLERKFGFRGYLWAARIEAVNVLGRRNPDTVVNNVDAPNFGAFAGGQGRATTLRVRLAGRKWTYRSSREPRTTRNRYHPPFQKGGRDIRVARPQ